MKYVLAFCLTIFLSANLFAQQKDFEGVLTYKVDVRSKKPEFSNIYWRNIMGYGDQLTISIKQGNYLRQCGITTEYHSQGIPKVFIKINGIDTLFYLDYDSDSSTLVSVTKKDEQKKIAGFDCSSITIKTSRSTNQYFYAPALYMNPEYFKGYKLSKYDEYLKHTSSVYLATNDEYEAFILSSTCTNVEQKKLDESVFKLPDLPRVEFSADYFTKLADFGRSMGWQKYLQTSLKADLGARYVKIPSGQKEATQTVIVKFVVTRTGELADIKVENKKEVHPKLAEEAVRVITESGRWKPATYLGEKINYYVRQPITFAVSKG